MIYILDVKLGIRTRIGHHIHAAVDVCDIYVADSLALTNTLPFAFLNVWRKQKDHLTDYYRLTKIHDGFLPVPKPPQQWTLHEGEPTNTYPEDVPGPSCSSVELDFLERTVPHLISQSELNDLLRHLNLSKI
jgi:hypothetical protein